MLAQSIAKRFRDHVERLGWSHSKAARRAKISRKTVLNILRGETWFDLPTIDRMERNLGIRFWNRDHHPPRGKRLAPHLVVLYRSPAELACRRQECRLQKGAPVALPKMNPIDTGCVPHGWPIDHLGSRTIWCPKCEGLARDSRQPGEVFQVICGSGIGFGLPGFVRSFLKHTSTAGKMGKRGMMEQCATCGSVYPDEEDGTARWWAEQTSIGQHTNVRRVTASTNSGDHPSRLLLLSAGSPSLDRELKQLSSPEAVVAALREDARTELDGLKVV